MTSAPWTPGPWRAELDKFTDEEGLQWTVMSGTRGEGWLLFTGYGPGIEAVREKLNDTPEAEANARLVALAPEMAELLKRWVSGKSDKSIFSDTAAVLVKAGV